MAKPLSGQIAVVTGGTRGIGRAIAEALLDAGAGVVICGRREPDVARAVEQMAKAGNAIIAGRACDVARYEEVAALFRFIKERFDRLDILVNNAGVGVFERVDLISAQDWRQVVETNLSGAFYCTREAAPLMRQHGGGFIINIGSLAGKNAMAGGSAYNASKFGLIGLSEASMLDLRYDNIRVSCVMPGSVATEFGGPGGASGEWKIAPRDIAETVLHLLQLPPRTLASRVEVRPTRPPRKG
ncbi:MAG TPA: SDR family oxidoreductase [Bryobacterales bacterium]|nr:SDR family oxidoreductase [Bryobacterales bacterium]